MEWCLICWERLDFLSIVGAVGGSSELMYVSLCYLVRRAMYNNDHVLFSSIIWYDLFTWWQNVFVAKKPMLHWTHDWEYKLHIHEFLNLNASIWLKPAQFTDFPSKVLTALCLSIHLFAICLPWIFELHVVIACRHDIWTTRMFVFTYFDWRSLMRSPTLTQFRIIQMKTLRRKDKCYSVQTFLRRKRRRLSELEHLKLLIQLHSIKWDSLCLICSWSICYYLHSYVHIKDRYYGF